MTPTRLDAERQAAVLALIEKYHGKIRGILFGSWPGLAQVAAAVLTEEELESACLYGLVRAAARYNPGKANLTTFAAWWIRNSVQEAIAEARGVPRMNGRRAVPVTPHQQWGEDETGRVYDYPDPKAGQVGAETERTDLAAAVRRAMGRICPRRAEVLTRLVVGGQTLDQVAADLGVSRERVRQLRDSGAKLFRRQWEVPCER